MMSLLEQTLSYHQRGLCVIPVPLGKKAAQIRWKKYQTERPTDGQVHRWFSGQANIAVVLGEVSGGLSAMDFDTAGGYEHWAAEYPDLARNLPTVKTARGYHVYFSGEVKGAKHFQNKDGQHLGELRGSGHYCLLPPSKHPSGTLYRWLNPLPDFGVPVIDPELAGFNQKQTYNHVTESTESTEEYRGEPKEVRGVCGRGEGAVEAAIRRTLPQNIGARKHCVFAFARELKSMPEYENAPPKELRVFVEEWHRQALRNIGTKPFEESWIDFIQGWDRVKWKIHESPLAKLFEKVKKKKPPPEAVRNFPDHPNLQFLTSLCRELHRKSRPAPAFLAVRAGGRLFGVSKMTFSRWFFLLEYENLIKVVAKGGTKENPRATRFAYTGDEHEDI